MNRVKLFAIANLIQIICLSGLFIYFFNKKEMLMASLILFVVAVSLLVITIPDLLSRIKTK